jgi:hypothetical protein
MWRNNQSRHYTVCTACTRWIWTDRLRTRPNCVCGKAFHKGAQKNGAKAPGSKPQPQQQQQPKRTQAGASEVKGHLESLFQVLLASLSEEKRAKFQQDFPELQSKSETAKPKDPFRLASEEAAKAFKEYKRLAEKKHQIELKAKRLQIELDKCSEQLAETTQQLEEAQAKHERHQRTYAEVVQQSLDETAETQRDEEEMSLDGCEEDITGDELEIDDSGRKKHWQRRVAQRRQQQQQPQQQPQQQQGPSGPAVGTGAAVDELPETEEFKNFKAMLSEEQRALLHRQMQLAVERASAVAGASQQQQQQQQTALEAKELLAASKLLGSFAEALNTQESPQCG